MVHVLVYQNDSFCRGSAAIRLCPRWYLKAHFDDVPSWMLVEECEATFVWLPMEIGMGNGKLDSADGIWAVVCASVGCSKFREATSLQLELGPAAVACLDRHGHIINTFP